MANPRMAAILSREVAFFDVMVFWWFGGLVVVLRSCALVRPPDLGIIALPTRMARGWFTNRVKWLKRRSTKE
jgi:hypothetical protein